MLKVKYQGQARIFRLLDPSLSFEELTARIRNNFSDVPANFYFIFIDPEDDQIQITTTNDLQAVFSLVDSNYRGKGPKIVKLEVRQKKQNEMNEEDQSSFEVLAEMHFNSQNEIQDMSQFIEVLDSNDGEIQDLVRIHLKNLEEECIDKIEKEIEENSISIEVINFLQEVYRSIENNPILDKTYQQSNKASIQTENENIKDSELLYMVQKKLQKLLPSFIDTLTDRTMAAVRLYLKNRYQDA